MGVFSESDVLKLAIAILESPVEYFDSDRYSHYYCNYCEAELDWRIGSADDFKHELDCPVLVAQDILTGMENKIERLKTCKPT